MNQAPTTEDHLNSPQSPRDSVMEDSPILKAHFDLHQLPDDTVMEEAPVTSEFNEGIHNACDTMDLREPEADSGRNQTDNAQLSFEQQPSSLYSNSLDPTPLPATDILQPASM